MRRLQALFALLLLSALTALAQNNVQLVIEGKVINVHDGDTITVLDKENKKFHIRLQGIDAPEIKQKYGPESQKNLERMVMGKQVTIVWNKVDKYRRTVGTIMLEGRDINIEQVKAGLAWHFKKYAEEQPPADRITYAKAEEQARAAKLGLWQDPNPTPPGDYRVAVKEARWGPPPPPGTIIGNKNSMKYHRPDCPGYKDMAEKNRVFFKSVEEAEAAGYKRAGNCPPEDESTARQSSTNNSTQSTRTSSQAQSRPATTTATANNPSSGDVIGNKNSKKYHLQGCPGYTQTSEKNRVIFKSAAEAEAAGYTRAGNCQGGDNSSSVAKPKEEYKPATPSAQVQTSSTAPSTSAPQSGLSAGDLVGNKNSKKYHLPGCPGYNQVGEKNRVVFKSVAEAEAAGYTKAGNCKQ